MTSFERVVSAGQRPPGVRRALQVLLVGAAGLFLFRFGLPGIVLGGSYVAGGSPVTAHLDSETRFLSALALGLGCLALWLSRNFEAYPALAAFIATFTVLGGLMRIVSMALHGIPNEAAIVATALEIVIPLTIVVLLSRRVAAD